MLLCGPIIFLLAVFTVDNKDTEKPCNKEWNAVSLGARWRRAYEESGDANWGRKSNQQSGKLELHQLWKPAYSPQCWIFSSLPHRGSRSRGFIPHYSVVGVGLLSKDDNSLVFLASKAGYRGQIKPSAK